MEKEFCTYETALALKELGFDEPCLTYYKNDGEFSPLPYEKEGFTLSDLDKAILSPLYQQVFRWFREKHYYSEINVGCTQIDGAIGFSWRIWKPWLIEEWSPERPGEEWSYETYEEAESACLDELIEIARLTKP